MTDEAVLILVWRCGGETVVIPMTDGDGNDNLLMTMLVEKLPERVKNTAEAAVLRGTIADLRGVILRQRRSLEEASKLADHYREVEQESAWLKELEHIVPVEKSP